MTAAEVQKVVVFGPKAHLQGYILPGSYERPVSLPAIRALNLVNSSFFVTSSGPTSLRWPDVPFLSTTPYQSLAPGLYRLALHLLTEGVGANWIEILFDPRI